MGRTKNYKKRIEAHSKNPLRENLKPDEIITGLNYYESRFYEQMFMLYYQTINKNDEKMNQIRGISPLNSNRNLYFIRDIELLPYIENNIENDLLNWLGY